MMRLAFVVCAALCAAAARGAEVKVVPVAEGMLIDANGDGVADEARVGTDGKPMMEVLAGKLGRGLHKGVFEFDLAGAAGKTLDKATLTLSLNGNSGCHPDQAGLAGPQVELWSYAGVDADGKIALTDDGPGEKLGLAMERKAVENARAPVVVDVTEGVRRALAEGAPRIGFRAEASEADAKPDAPAVTLRFRTAAFAKAYHAGSSPTLTLSVQ